ncbi:hypothetical protein [Roseibium sp.]|uniref:hypothetical protein n=1 Tax=Roseibium sp. TaxID=1936156 RepID=UPI003B5255B8
MFERQKAFEAALAFSVFKMDANDLERDTLRSLSLKLGQKTMFSSTDVVRVAGMLSDFKVTNARILNGKLERVLDFACQRGVNLVQSAYVVSKMA